MAVDVGCEEVEEEGAPQCGDVLVLHLWVNADPVRLKCVSCVRCVASLLALPVVPQNFNVVLI